MPRTTPRLGRRRLRRHHRPLRQPASTSTPTAATRTPRARAGFGHQGAEPRDIRAIFGSYAAGVIASESRSLLAGPDGLADAIARRADEYGAALPETTTDAPPEQPTARRPPEVDRVAASRAAVAAAAPVRP